MFQMALTMVPRIIATTCGTVRYNRDWLRYMRAHFVRDTGETLLRFRLRNKQTVVLRASVRTTLNEIYLHRVYDIPGVHFRSCRHVFDFGANMGVFALYIGARAPAASISCFEPSTANFAMLEQNLVANQVPARAYRMAISTLPGPRRLSLAAHSGGYALDRSVDRFEKVECADLAKVFSLTGVDICDFLKMDIEGEELNFLLESPIDLLRRIRAIAVEWHHSEASLRGVQSRLERAGFATRVDRVGEQQRQVMLKAVFNGNALRTKFP